MSDIAVESMESLDSNCTTQQFPISNLHADAGPRLSMPMSQEMLTSYKQKGQSESMSANLDFQQQSVGNSQKGQSQNMHATVGQEKLFLPNKRKATTDLMPNSQGLQKMTIPSKRAVLGGSSPKTLGVPQLSASSKRTAESQSKSPRSSVSSKKVVQVHSSMNKSQSVTSSSDASESVRSKLRESLSAALALVSQNRENSPGGEKKSENEVALTMQKELESLSGSSTAKTSKTGSVSESCDSCINADIVSQEVPLKDISGEAPQDWKFVGNEFQANPVLPGEDSPFTDGFFFKDELLQGNGLSWAMDLDSRISEVQEVESTQKEELAHDDVSEGKTEQAEQSPESVALKIELELFKLFGGVNKKYKEKGRSLIFNLKDRNNPELRERVMSGEISPERLCSMTAEELASKELSQWRMAKAEELDQMKVLPDSEVDVRRLVKKTHKGEYQVEFDQDVSVVEDVSPDTSVMPQNRQKKSVADANQHKIADRAKEDDDIQCRFTIPGDGADMQGLMVDYVRDLPPIVSLDEFMESLDKEPPFENLPVDSGRTTPVSDKESTKVVPEFKTPVLPSNDPVETTLQNKGVGAVNMKPDADVKPTAGQNGSDTNYEGCHTKVDHVWEGSLQLNLSSMATVMAIYKSGDKVPTKEWPDFFKIKGRVRLDPFDKFLQELPMSRSRSIMVAHFVLKDGCTGDERTSLIELIDSYIADQRLGFAEPAPGVELYLCPPRSRPVEMVIDHLPKEYTEKINDIDIGLIGVFVWRKERIASAISPNPTAQHKQTNKPPPPSSGRQLPDKDMMHNNVNFASSVVPRPPSLCKPASNDNDDGDVPPGFGPPGGSRDDDDLPEFNFSGGPNPSRPKIPNPNAFSGRGMGPHHLRPGAPSQVEQMRELIQRYGHSAGVKVGHSIPMQQWNTDDDDDDDDDDDIPEWQPQAPPHQPPLHPPGHPTQIPPLMPHVNRPVLQPLIPLAKPMNPLQPPTKGHGLWWPFAPNNMPPPGDVGGQSMGDQIYGASVNGHSSTDWRPPNAYRSRGS